jgi:hypothetical protein
MPRVASPRGTTQAVQERPSAVVNQEDIARVAYELYLKRGRTAGRDLDDWLNAEAILRKRGPSR